MRTHPLRLLAHMGLEDCDLPAPVRPAPELRPAPAEGPADRDPQDAMTKAYLLDHYAAAAVPWAFARACETRAHDLARETARLTFDVAVECLKRRDEVLKEL